MKKFITKMVVLYIKIPTQLLLVYNKTNACMACLGCVQACSNAYYKTFDPALSCIQIVDKKGDAKPMVCPQCGKCAEACPNDAIKYCIEFSFNC